uniref:Membrane spanning 4-domains A12 n=1 Tax=Microcebus murinus TaxID=30608 RepID=A0A8C5YDI5_MICMU|nr:membrane-spanning 4-domains subfamily A member 12 [Microcebus murinus]XP_012612463.1 membrane-spanning 4-domains subfamily A member 12 [Microcebus murinus]
MMSSQPTSHHGFRETIPNPYTASSFVAPRFQQPQPLGSINQGNQAQGDQPPFTISSGTFAGSQLGQGNTQMTNPSMERVATNFREEAKTLAAIQIVIGLMQIGFGIILGLLRFSYGQNLGFISITFIGGYPFWGGLCFIISGSLSISATKETSSCLIKSSLGTNIISCIFAINGVILLLMDISSNVIDGQSYWTVVSGKGISAMLMIFSVLELCIACATAHFAQKIISNTSRAVLVIPAPTVYANNPLPPEYSSVPPRNDAYPAYPPSY